jgi:GxxExxY protein
VGLKEINMGVYLQEESYNIIGVCFEVHNVLGSGFLEEVYKEALAIEMDEMGMPYAREEQINIYYKSKILKKKFRSDFLCYSSIIVEVKAKECLILKDYSQILNYLNATGLRLGIIVNFGETSLKYKRILL